MSDCFAPMDCSPPGSSVPGISQARVLKWVAISFSRGSSCMDVRVGLWRKLSTEKLMLLNCGVGEDSWESLGLQGDPASPSWRRSVLGVHWKDWCWSWNSNTLATSCKELTPWKRPWWWEGLGAGEVDDRGWDGWIASPTWWAWVWVNSGSWWWTGRPGVLRFMRSQRVGHDLLTETKLKLPLGIFSMPLVRDWILKVKQRWLLILKLVFSLFSL